MLIYVWSSKNMYTEWKCLLLNGIHGVVCCKEVGQRVSEICIFMSSPKTQWDKELTAKVRRSLPYAVACKLYRSSWHSNYVSNRSRSRSHARCPSSLYYMGHMQYVQLDACTFCSVFVVVCSKRFLSVASFIKILLRLFVNFLLRFRGLEGLSWCWSALHVGVRSALGPTLSGYSTVTASTVRITDLISLHLGIVYVITTLNLKDHR